MKEKRILNISEEDERAQMRQPLWCWILSALNILGLFFSVILSLHHLNGKLIIGCNGGNACDQVLNSNWSMLAGIIPVSSLAVGIYSSMFIAAFFIGSNNETSIRRLTWNVLLIIAGSIVGSAVWFFILQNWVIGIFCLYCMITHLIGLSIAALVIWFAGQELKILPAENFPTNENVFRKIFFDPRNRFFVFGKILIGLALAGILAIFQIITTPSTIFEDGKFQNSLYEINYKTAPLIGSSDAPCIVTVLFDYQCPHCQKIHFMLDEIVKRYDHKLAFALCPAPLDSHCNHFIPRDVDAFKNSCEIAKIGLAVWYAKPEAFPAFENWMYTFESGEGWKPRSLESVRNKATELIGTEKLDTALIDRRVAQFLQASIKIYGKTIQNGNGAIPKLIFGFHWVVPEVHNADDLISILQNSLGVPKS